MTIASLQFLAFAVIAACVYNLFRSVGWRQWTLFAGNLFALCSFTHSISALLPFVGFLLLGYLSVQAMQSKGMRKTFVPLLIIVIAAFVWLKKYTILPSAFSLQFSYVTIGISYILFRILHMMIDAHAGQLPEKVSPLSYLNYAVNFMTLVSGPIQQYEGFAESQLAAVRPPLTIFQIGDGIHRVVIGFFKVTVLSWLFSLSQKKALAAVSSSAPVGSLVLAGAVVAVSYPLFLYFNFSGYTDIVIGIGRFFRFTLPENFDRPFFSRNFINFWDRWHITLSHWLKTYVFNPLLLASMRRVSAPRLEPFLSIPALFITFFLVGVWHGQTSEFLVFGFLQGFGVAANQLFQILMEKSMGRERYRSLAANPLYVPLSRGLTFTWFTFTLVWFWSNWQQMGHIEQVLGLRATQLAFLAIFVAATFILALLEAIRDWALSVRWNDTPLALSRYSLTVFDTALVVVSAVVVIVLNSPAPDIVYKAF